MMLLFGTAVYHMFVFLEAAELWRTVQYTTTVSYCNSQQRAPDAQCSSDWYRKSCTEVLVPA